MFGFGGNEPKKSEKDRIKDATKEGKRDIRSGRREMDREVRGLEREEKKIVAQLKAEVAKGKGGTDPVVKSLAKQLTQVRKARERLIGAQGTLRGVETQITTAGAAMKAGLALGTAASVLKRGNDEMMKSGVMDSVRDFAVASERMGMSEDMMDDMLADAFDDDEIEEEADGVVSSVMEEIGLDLRTGLASVPTGTGAGVRRHEAEAAPDMDAIMREAAQ